jgi:hypothetical protein
MDHRARVEQAVFDFLRPQLKQYRQQATDLARATASSIAKVTQHADDVVLQRRRELKRAQDALESCRAQEGADCSGYYRQVQLCEQALQRAIQGRELIEQASATFRHAQSRHETAVDQTIVAAEKIVRSADERTIGYQKSSGYSPSVTMVSAAAIGGGGGSTDSALASAGAAAGPFGGGGRSSDPAPAATSWRDLPGVNVPAHFPEGFALIPVGLIANDNPVIGPHEFDAGQNLADLSWSSEALLDVVMPAVSKVSTAQTYLAERDAREGLSGSRSYTATYSGFFSPSTAIRLRPLDNGTFDLINGRHRLWLISHAGAEHVPALISGGH